MDQAIESQMAKAKIVGVGAAIIVDKRVVWTKGYGFADREHGRPFTADTVMNIGSISIGNATNLGAELLRSMLGLRDATLVTYRSTPDLLNATATGEVQVASEILPPALPQITGGRIRAIAIAAPERFARLPDVPTSAESGLPGYVVRSWNGIALPANTPRPIVERLNAELRRILDQPDIRERLLDMGVSPSTCSPEEFRAFFVEEGARWARVIADAGIEKQ